jgi:hypothetical protein
VKTYFSSSFSSQLTLENAHTNFVFSTWEDYNAPSRAESFIATIWTMGNCRCTLHDDTILCFKFVMVVVAPILAEYLDLLLQWSQEDEALTALADDVAMEKVSLH